MGGEEAGDGGRVAGEGVIVFDGNSCQSPQIAKVQYLKASQIAGGHLIPTLLNRSKYWRNFILTTEMINYKLKITN